MKITINDEEMTFPAPLSLDDVLDALSRSRAGTALAVNQQIVPRDRWSAYHLQEGDELVIFQAIAGG